MDHSALPSPEWLKMKRDVYGIGAYRAMSLLDCLPPGIIIGPRILVFFDMLHSPERPGPVVHLDPQPFVRYHQPN